MDDIFKAGFVQKLAFFVQNRFKAAGNLNEAAAGF
jgi:hypothetical protein